jgi:hypothetical protein
MSRLILTLSSLLILLTSFQAFSFQNIDKLLADPDITWAGEVYVDYLPNTSIIEPLDSKIVARYGIDDYNAFEILKIQHSENEDWLNPSKNQLSSRLLQLSPNNLNVYKNASLTKKLSYEEYKDAAKYVVLDTLITLDPETREEIFQRVVNFVTPKDIALFRVKQILTYKAKTNQLNIIPIAMAPIATTLGRKDTIRQDILFWVPIKEVSKQINLDKTSIDWAKRLTREFYSKDVKVIKGTGNLASTFDKMIVYYRKNPSTTKLYVPYNKELKPCSSEYIKNIGISTDTIITFHPETFKEMTRVVKRVMTPEKLTKIRIYQNWAWDNKTQEIQIRLLGFAPIIQRKDSALKYGPFHYIKSNK